MKLKIIANALLLSVFSFGFNSLCLMASENKEEEKRSDEGSGVVTTTPVDSLALNVPILSSATTVGGVARDGDQVLPQGGSVDKRGEERALLQEIFDNTYYMTQYGDAVKVKGVDALSHYLDFGWQENYNPNAWFNGAQYTKQFGGTGNPALDWLRQPSGVTSAAYPEEVIMCLTSHPPRIGTTWLAVESLMRQTTRPNRIVLNLAQADFPDQMVPLNLRVLGKRGLEIRFSPVNYKVATKLLPTLKDFPDAIVVTGDDDRFYHPLLLATLLKQHSAHPTAIISPVARAYTYDQSSKSISYNAHLTSPLYSHINYLEQKPLYDQDDQEAFGIFEGFAGVLYPPGSFTEEVFNFENFKKLTPYADDVWFQCMAALKGTKTRGLSQADAELLKWPSEIDNTQEAGLFHQHLSANDWMAYRAFYHYNLLDRIGVPKSDNLKCQRCRRSILADGKLIDVATTQTSALAPQEVSLKSFNGDAGSSMEAISAPGLALSRPTGLSTGSTVPEATLGTELARRDSVLNPQICDEALWRGRGLGRAKGTRCKVCLNAKPRKVLCIGAYDYGNIGDRLYSIILKSYLGDEFDVFTIPDTVRIDQNGLYMPMKSSTEDLDYDAVVIGGGGILREFPADSSIGYYMKQAITRDKPFFLISAGMQTERPSLIIPEAEALLGTTVDLLRQASLLFVRSQKDYFLLRSLLGEEASYKLFAMSDLGYLFPTAIERLGLPPFSAEKKYVTLIQTGSANVKNPYVKAKLDEKLKEFPDSELVVMNWGGIGDPRLKKDFRDWGLFEETSIIYPKAKIYWGDSFSPALKDLFYKTKVIRESDLTPFSAAEIVARSHYVLSGRYHGEIIARAYDVPFEQVIFSYKVNAELESPLDTSTSLQSIAMLKAFLGNDCGSVRRPLVWSEDERNGAICQVHLKYSDFPIPFIQAMDNTTLYRFLTQGKRERCRLNPVRRALPVLPPASPAVQPPAVDAPASPAVQPPAVDAPASPAVQPPAVDAPAAPVVSPPAVDAPASPAVQPPAADAPAAPVVSPPAADAPASPAVQPPAADLPASPAVQPPAADAPAAPAVQPPAADLPATPVVPVTLPPAADAADDVPQEIIPSYEDWFGVPTAPAQPEPPTVQPATPAAPPAQSFGSWVNPLNWFRWIFGF